MEEHWPVVLVLTGAIGGIVAWLKRHLIDDVYATKAEVLAMAAEIELKITEHEDKVDDMYLSLHTQMSDNHDEIKDLIISQLVSKS